MVRDAPQATTLNVESANHITRPAELWSDAEKKNGQRQENSCAADACAESMRASHELPLVVCLAATNFAAQSSILRGPLLICKNSSVARDRVSVEVS